MKPFPKKVRQGRGELFKHLGVRALVLGLRPWSGNCYPKYLMILVPVLTRKGRSWGMTYPPWSSPGWVRAQLAVPSGPGPQTLLCRLRWGGQASNPTGPQPPQAGHVVGGVGAGPAEGIPGGWCHQEVAEAGRGSLPPQGLGLASGGHSEGSGGQQDTAPRMSPGPSDHRWSEAGWTEAPWGEGRVDSYLTVHLMIPAPLTLAECPQ